MKNVHTFTHASDQYAKHRPQYPDEMFAYLSGLVESHESAWDCATGNGQAAVSVAKYFSHVEATDISDEQIKNGIAHPRVRYSVSPAEQTQFQDESFDLVVVATAVHWFDLDRFFRELDRVLRLGGVLAVWSYSYFHIEPDIDAVIRTELLEPIDRFWASGNRQVLLGYPDIRLPFTPIKNIPAFSTLVEWTMEQLTAYVRTWSAVKRHITEVGLDPVAGLESRLKTVWREPQRPKQVRMPLTVKASKKSA
jgi:ubiquinone/menaquinone biosynthesis C-methylase UbiE